MEPTLSAGGAGEDTTTRGAVPVDRVLVVRVNEDAPAKSDAAKRPDQKSATALEWTKAAGMPLVTILVTLVGGFYFTNLTNDREAKQASQMKEREADQARLMKEREVRESNERLYAQLLMQREQSDTLIRKDMFGVVIKSFLADTKKEDWNDKILHVELLANNFNQSLDLAPLFKDLANRLPKAPGLTPTQMGALKKRLDETAANLIFKQVISLAQRGYSEGYQESVHDWKANFGKPFINRAVAKSRLVPSTADAPVGEKEQIKFLLEIVDVNIDRQKVEVRLRVYFPGEDVDPVDRHFWVGRYDFPMLDNIQLPYGLRASVVITDFVVPKAKIDRERGSFVNFHLVVFPAASASFKERQAYDDILLDMLRTNSK